MGKYWAKYLEMMRWRGVKINKEHFGGMWCLGEICGIKCDRKETYFASYITHYTRYRISVCMIDEYMVCNVNIFFMFVSIELLIFVTIYYAGFWSSIMTSIDHLLWLASVIYYAFLQLSISLPDFCMRKIADGRGCNRQLFIENSELFKGGQYTILQEQPTVGIENSKLS